MIGPVAAALALAVAVLVFPPTPRCRLAGVEHRSPRMIDQIITARLAFLVSGGTGAGKTAPHLYTHCPDTYARFLPRLMLFPSLATRYARFRRCSSCLGSKGCRGQGQASSREGYESRCC
jgi:hypothetical protein